MALDYKRSYKTKLRRRKILTISIISVVFLLASFSILYFKFWSKDSQQNPEGNTSDLVSASSELTTTEEPTTETPTTEEPTSEDATAETAATEDTATEEPATEGSDTTEEITTEATEETTAEPTTEVTASNGGKKRGLALTRQPIMLYSIGVGRISLADVNREYVRVETTVSDSYFDDALFIGDSRTEGFMLYSSISNIRAYSSKGLSISRIYTDAIVTMEDGRVVTVMEALQEQQFNKIYIMFGVNELGWPSDEIFRDQYSKLVQDIKLLQPDATIYIQNILPISAERSASDPIYNNDNVRRFNALIEEVAKEQNVIYLDVSSALADETGALPAGASVDGIHCNGEFCDKWLMYLKNNTYELK